MSEERVFMSTRRKGSIFLIEPTIVILPNAAKGLGEFKFIARQEYPREHMASLEGFIEGSWVYIEDFIDNIEYTQPDNFSLDYPSEAVTRAKQAAAGRQRRWLGTVHSHPEGIIEISETDHVSGHFFGETVSAIYAISKSKKNGRLYSPPLRWFVPQGRLKVVGP